MLKLYLLDEKTDLNKTFWKYENRLLNLWNVSSEFIIIGETDEYDQKSKLTKKEQETLARTVWILKNILGEDIKDISIERFNLLVTKLHGFLGFLMDAAREGLDLAEIRKKYA